MDKFGEDKANSTMHSKKGLSRDTNKEAQTKFWKEGEREEKKRGTTHNATKGTDIPSVFTLVWAGPSCLVPF